MLINKIKTIILLSLLSGLLMALGLAIGGTDGLEICLILSLMMNFFAYFYSDKIVLRMYNAQPLDKEKFTKIYHIINELSKKMDLPMPKLWLIDTPMANAFATGRNPENASVAVTTGILNILDDNEIRAVLSHELSHVKNRDILITTIAATIATTIGYIANMLQYAAIWGSATDRKKGNQAGMILVAILMPIAATFIQLAISRSREYLADETGADCCKDPLALASALEKLHYNIQYSHLNNNDTLKASTASLFIVHPFTSIDWLSLFSTHPPMHKRVAKLRKIYEKMCLN